MSDYRTAIAGAEKESAEAMRAAGASERMVEDALLIVAFLGEMARDGHLDRQIGHTLSGRVGCWLRMRKSRQS